MKRLSEGKKMFVSVMAIFFGYSATFIILEDYDRRVFEPMADQMDWHLLLFSLVVMAVLAFLLHRYSMRMDARISKEQAEKQNALRRELTQNIAHELKTPVASILGYTETILENPDITEDMKLQFVVRSHSQAKRLTSLLQDISTLNRMDYATQIIEMDEVNLSGLVADIAEETLPALRHRRMVFQNQMPNHVVIKGNISLLYSIFRNLVENAIDYAGEGTCIKLSASEQGNHWCFTFSDNGIGVAKEHLSRIFERFYRIDKGRNRQMGGTGLGLAIVKNAIQLHGGMISAYRPEEGGLGFNFTLRR